MNIINEKVVTYIDGLYKPLNNKLKELRSLSEERHIPIILRDTENFLVPIMEMNRPKKILEIGTAIGYSAAFMATISPWAHITSIEKEERSYKEAKEHIKNMGFEERVDLIFNDATLALDELVKNIKEKKLEKYDLIFIDAGKSHYREFWDRAIKISKPGTVIICDNILMKASVADESYDKTGRFKTSIRNMRDFLEYITNIENVKTSILSIGDGVSISYVK